jgi:protein-S-isoprenylcysteine O-methyltransferase Ste14
MMLSSTWFSALALLATLTIYGLVHSWLASLQAKALARRMFGPAAGRFYRLAYNLFAVVSFLPALAILAYDAGATLYTIPWPWTLLTLAIQALAGLALLAGVAQTGLAVFIGLAQVFDPAVDEGPFRLQTGGLYRWARHPLYTAGLVILWLTPVMTTHVLIFNLGLSAYVIIGAKFEERKLLRQYGQAYQGYQQRTPMFLKLW